MEWKNGGRATWRKTILRSVIVTTYDGTERQVHKSAAWEIVGIATLLALVLFVAANRGCLPW
jgi:hypothetical protein